jgi:hypothetical protein
MIGELRGERVEKLEAIIRGRRIRRGKIDDGLANDTAQAQRLQRTADFRLEIVHVGNGGDAAFGQFDPGEQGADAHHFRRYETLFQRENIALQPVRLVVAETPEQRHRHVAMGIDHARHQNVALHVDGLAVYFRWVAGSNVGYLAAIDQQIARPMDRHVAIDRHDNPIG